MRKVQILVLCLMLTGLLAACGERGSGFAPAKNALTANPEETIDLRARDYELPPATPAPGGPTASYDTGDSSGGRTLTLDTLNPALERAAAEPELSRNLGEAVAENALAPGTSTTIADETSEGDAAAVTGGEQNVTTDTADTITDTVVDPATAGENAVETAPNTVADETGGAETGGTTPAAADQAAADQAATDQAATDQAATDQAATAETGGTAPGETTPEEAATDQPAAAGQTGEVSAQAESGFDWQELGTTTYNGNCAACHQQTGQGVPGAFPPLAGHMNELFNAEGGRSYLVNVLLYGLQGQIDALGQSYNGVMPPWAQLSNEQIAATLNHELTSWGNDALLTDFTPILPDEVEAERGNNLSAAQVLELRPQLP